MPLEEGDRETLAVSDACWSIRDDRAQPAREVVWAVDFHSHFAVGACHPHASIREQQRGGVVEARHLHRRVCRPGLGRRVEDLWLHHRIVVLDSAAADDE
jgi:hypothetical protein